MKQVLLILALASSLYGQNPAVCNTATPAICTPGSPSGEVQIKPQAVPTSTATVTTNDAYITLITVTNPSASAVTITIADRQGTPVQIPGSGTVVAAGTSFVMSFSGRGYWCPGGFTILASGAGLNYYARWAN